MPKILLYDLETGFNLLASHSLYTEYLPYTSIVRERYVICGSWKELGNRETHSAAVTDFSRRFRKDPTDDYDVVYTLWKALSNADAIIAHNGDKFDIRRLNSRVIYHGFPPIKPLIQIDTLKMARSKFDFNANRLDYLAKYLKVGEKIKTDAELWHACMNGDAEAVAKMVRYNRKDVVLLEKVYNRLAPFCPTKLNHNLFTQEQVCPKCGSAHVQRRGVVYTKTRAYRRYVCTECGSWSNSTLSEKEIRAGLK